MLGHADFAVSALAAELKQHKTKIQPDTFISLSPIRLRLPPNRATAPAPRPRSGHISSATAPAVRQKRGDPAHKSAGGRRGWRAPGLRREAPSDAWRCPKRPDREISPPGRRR